MAGILSLGLTLPILWTVYKHQSLSETSLFSYFTEEEYLNKVIGFCCQRPAELMGISKAKGGLQKGKKADFAIFDPNASYKLDQYCLKYKYP